MTGQLYRYDFDPSVPFGDVEETLILAVLAAEGLHGRSPVRLDAFFSTDLASRSCVLDTATEVGRSIARIFTGFVSHEFGEESFKIERLGESNWVGVRVKANGGA